MAVLRMDLKSVVIINDDIVAVSRPIHLSVTLN